MEDDYEPNPISIATIKAIEVEDGNDDNRVYVYFDFPSKLCGKEISFTANFLNNASANGPIKMPLFFKKSEIPISFSLTTVSTIGDKEYESNPSELITIGYPKLVSLNIDFIHNNDEPIEIEFERDIDFNTFKKLVIESLNLDEDDVRIGLNNNDKMRILNERSFKTVLSGISVSTSSFTLGLSAGFAPIVPKISDINVKDESGKFNISLQRLANNVNNTSIFDIQSENKEDITRINKDNLKTKQLFPTTTLSYYKSLTLHVTGLRVLE